MLLLTIFESLVIMISFSSLIIALITLTFSMTRKK
ncbi:MAG: putative holin-like toxin [Psychrobacillus psychrotolerans]